MSTDNDDNGDVSDDNYEEHDQTRTSRRTFLGSMAAAGALGAGLGTGTATATQAENLSWSLQNVIYDLFPDDPSCANNVLVHRTEQFPDSSGITEVSNYGSDLQTTYNGDSVTIENTSGSVGEDWLLPWSNIPKDVPAYALYASIDSFGGGEAIVGVYNDVDNHVEARLSQNDGNIQIFEYLNGGISAETELQASVPSAPVDVLVTFMGDAVAVNYREDGGVWQYAGWTSLGTNFYDQSYISNFRPGVGALFNNNNATTFSELRVLSTQQFGYRDPFLVTHKDGAPMIEDDQYIYMCWSAGAPELQYGATNVYKIDIINDEIEMVGRLHYETRNGQVYPDYPTKIIYDDDTGEFIALVSGWVTYTAGPDDVCHTYVTRTTTNILEGLHVLSVDDANLPGTGQEHVYDISLFYDSGAGKWRGFANNSNGAMNTIETSDDSLTGGWSALTFMSSSEVGGGVIEGGRVRRVDGEPVAFWANQNAPETMSVSNYPDFDTNIQDVTTDADRWSSTLPSHPMVVEIPDSANNETSYKMYTFGNRTYEDMGALYSEGEMLIFEADQTNSGLEYDSHSFPSGVGASSSSGCTSSGPIPEGRYWIENVNSGKAMDVNGGSTSDGADVIQWGYWGGANQQWDITQNSDGTYTITNVNSGKLLEVAGGGTSDGDNVQQYSDTGCACQKWNIIENSDGTYRLENANSGKVADVDGGSTSDGATVLQWGWWGGDNQKWTFNSV
ncbi:MAG: RICIN domain-containing protein [Haloarculaceae archaeon]